MTVNKNFKRRVRARMALTGESYCQARMKLLDERCHCVETYPQLQPGRINHGPGCIEGTPPTGEQGAWPGQALAGKKAKHLGVCATCGRFLTSQGKCPEHDRAKK